VEFTPDDSWSATSDDAPGFCLLFVYCVAANPSA
jgi:hypothetical protein